MNSNTHNTEKTIIGHPNVLIDSKDKPEGQSVETHTLIYETLSPLLELRPMWRFVGTAFYQGYANVLTGVRIFEGAEILGDVSVEYSRRGYKVCVKNHRITGKQVRGKGYFTEDAARATLHIRKNFYARDSSELIIAATQRAGVVASREYNMKTAELNEAKVAVYTKAKAFVRVREEEYFSMFPELLPARARREVATAMFNVVSSVNEALVSNKATLVVLNGDQYLTRTEGAVTRYTHETLPEHMRTKLGLLKLVQDKQMVSDVGCKVDAVTFVLLPQGDA